MILSRCNTMIFHLLFHLSSHMRRFSLSLEVRMQVKIELNMQYMHVMDGDDDDGEEKIMCNRK